MKKIGKILISIMMVVAVSGCVSSADTYEFNLKAYKRLDKNYAAAIIEFENKSKYGERRLSDAASEILTTEMLRTGNFMLVERERVEEIKNEINFSNSGLTEMENRSMMGKLLNAEYLLIGVVSNFGVQIEGRDMILYQEKIQRATSEVDIRVIDVETGRIEYSAFGRGVVENKISRTLGVGDSGSYDETMAGDCLRMAVNDAVVNLTSYFETKQ